MPIEPSDEEEKYLRTVDADARQRLRKVLEANAQAMEETSSIAAAVSTDDTALAEQIRKLGFDGESAKVFDLLPLVHVAWADGTVQAGERKAIMRVVASRGLGPDSDGAKLLAALLDERPPESFMRQSREVLGKLIGSTDAKADDIVELCMKVAAASGGFLGLGERIGDEERQLIAEISLGLGGHAVTT
ncbi:MAG: TerB family tellurite resistance protein, partial [Deltaproteobacteria bacterium]|nr:TerB family tellurite resistance protein [Nannocystaceae bacterium]